MTDEFFNQSAEGCEDMVSALPAPHSARAPRAMGMPRRKGREKLEINPLNQGRLLHGRED
jgi:hypothetical protein